jgi:two-component system sensor histidine kinase HydH
MAQMRLEELRHYIGFAEQDAAHLRALGEYAEELVPPTVERFYHEILRHPGTRTVLTEGPEQVSRLRKRLADWLRQLLCGTYDDAYWATHAAIGRVHVRVGLPQQYMCVAMEVVWQELDRGIQRLALPDGAATCAALHKLLTLELAVMLDSYRENYSAQIRQVEREAVQEQLTEAEHLAQIGQLAASLAHEIKNPLAGISGAIQVIRDSMRSDERHRPILDEVLRQVNRLDGTVKDLLIYARPKPPRLRKCSLDQLVARALTVLREQPEMQQVHLEYVNSQTLPPIEADENQLEQLLTNLLLNAAQASPADGLVRLTTTPYADGVRLTVADHGHGMDEEVRRRAMEPFFTTKARGTGLGLPICRKIVETHGGRITIHSIVGEGTEVVVELPRRQPASGSPGLRSAGSQGLRAAESAADDDPRSDR